VAYFKTHQHLHEGIDESNERYISGQRICRPRLEFSAYRIGSGYDTTYINTIINYHLIQCYKTSETETKSLNNISNQYWMQ
jgi:hypothetical protein